MLWECMCVCVCVCVCVYVCVCVFACVLGESISGTCIFSYLCVGSVHLLHAYTDEACVLFLGSVAMSENAKQ